MVEVTIDCEGRGACALTCSLEPPESDEGSFLSTDHMPAAQTEASRQLQCMNKVRKVCKPHTEARIYITHEHMLVAAHSR